MNTDLPFRVGELYMRREIHAQFGGQWRSGISTPSRGEYILLFTGSKGEAYGYFDEERADGTFSFFGEGRSGDMSFTRGNKKIRDHLKDGKRLLLFKGLSHGQCEYIGEMELLSHSIEQALDFDGNPRKSIVFKLKYLDKV